MNYANRNPRMDAQNSIEIFEKMVLPACENQGFYRYNKRSNIMINDSTKTILFVTSAPSQTKQPRYYKSKVKEFKSEYEGYSAYILFTRNKDEWSDKPTYMNTLRKILGLNTLRGVVCGLDNLVTLFDQTKNNSFCFHI